MRQIFQGVVDRQKTGFRQKEALAYDAGHIGIATPLPFVEMLLPSCSGIAAALLLTAVVAPEFLTAAVASTTYVQFGGE